MLSVKVTLCSALAGARKFTARHGTSSVAWESLRRLANSQGVSQENREPPQSVSTSSRPLCVPWWGRHLMGNFGCCDTTQASPGSSCALLPRALGWPRWSRDAGPADVCLELQPAGLQSTGNTHGSVCSCLCWKRGKALQISFSCSEIQWAI